MIVEVPNAADFAKASINLLNLAWEISIESIRAYDHSDVIHPNDTPTQSFVDNEGVLHTFGGPDKTYTNEERSAAETEFWRRSQPSLGNGLSLVQQAIEMGLKGRIAEVSPFLLISRDARDYPNSSGKQDVPFSAFRSLDASDLMRVHNTVCASRFDVSFGKWWDAIRRQRNALIHSVLPGASIVRPETLMENVIISNHILHPNTSWFDRRLEYSRNNEIYVAYHPDPNELYGQTLDEFDDALRFLPAKVSKEYFGYDRRSRTYTCIRCQDDCDRTLWYDWNLGKTAQLNPKGATSTKLRCVVCSRETLCMRTPCPDKECRGNVLCEESGDHYKTCLTCGEEWGISEDNGTAFAAGST